MPSARHKLLLLFPILLLILAIGLAAYGGSRVPEPRFHGEVAKLLPPAPPGWTMTEKSIADTPEMKEAVDELLNYSDGTFVEYSNGNQRLSVYIAYWVPGKMSHRLVAAHTPDVCWVGNGWEKIQSKQITDMVIENQPIPAIQDRLFEANGQAEYVWFWHLVGNESKSYGTGHVPPWHAAITDLWVKGLNQREEQFFIRISSNVPLEKLLGNSPLKAVLVQLPWPDTIINGISQM
ncbi:MAG: exosortase-associated EpsI family protein [Verrucomicrobiota bacterium]